MSKAEVVEGIYNTLSVMALMLAIKLSDLGHPFWAAICASFVPIFIVNATRCGRN